MNTVLNQTKVYKLTHSLVSKPDRYFVELLQYKFQNLRQKKIRSFFVKMTRFSNIDLISLTVE